MSAVNALGTQSKSPKSKFLRLYSLFLATEKHKSETRSQTSGFGVERARLENLETIDEEIEQDGAQSDGFLYYLQGLVRIEMNNKKGARDSLVQSVIKYPCNWSAWKALKAACPEYSLASSLDLPKHFTAQFFHASLCLDVQRPVEALSTLGELSKIFPNGDSLLLNAALAHNGLQNYDEAQQLFEELLVRDPNRIDGMDAFSNILYVKEANIPLSQLARRCTEDDPYRPETCCVTGNYYSLRGQHEKAVVYFRRALRLDQSYLPAWTLMGHEYVELKNPPGAIEAYHRAVQLDPYDYRAWYGLGQTYELVNMPLHALHYYRKAVTLRPKDARMWNAMAHCYASTAMDEKEVAVSCYRRALPHDREGVALRQLAFLHQKMGERDQAAHYFLLNLERVEADGLSNSSDAVEALQFLADYYQSLGNLELAQQYYLRLLDYGVPQQREAAKASLREITEAIDRNRQRETSGGSGSPGAMMLSTPGSDMGMTPTPPR